MDYTIFYIIGAVLISMGLAFGMAYLRKNRIIEADDIRFAVSILNLTMSIVDELNLKNESEIKEISKVVLLSLEYGVELYSKTDKESVIKAAKTCATALCLQKNIELTPERLNIVNSLIEIGYSKKYM